MDEQGAATPFVQCSLLFFRPLCFCEVGGEVSLAYVVGRFLPTDTQF